MSKLIVNVNITNSDLFKDTIKIIKDILEDSRIPEELRTEVKEKFEDILNKNKEA